jgi:hypothetical protein
MAVITLVEASKTAASNGQDLLAGIIRIFAEASGLVRVMPFQTIYGNALQYNLQGALPGIAFRGVNEAYTPSVGVINPQTEALKIIGGELTVDTAIIKSMGPDVRSTQVAMQATAISQRLGYSFIKGSSVDPREFDGLERRLTGGQVISNGAGDGGVALSIAKLDQAIDQTEQPTHLLMRKSVRRRLTEYLRDSPSIQTGRDEFGRQVMMYDGLQILLADEFGDTAAIDELELGSTGSTATATSIYVLRLESGYLNAIQNGVMEVTDLGVLHTSPAVGTRIEWLVGMALFHPRAATRLKDILSTTAAIA